MLTSWKNLWRPRLRGKPYYQDVVTILSMDDLPADIGLNIYLIRRGGTYRWAVLQCPCMCGRRVEVNLMRSRYPYWRVRKHAGSISLSPSLWVSEELCGNHFWVKRNRVVWAEFEPPRWTSEAGNLDVRG
jgi:Family of unknown function (DUF6527)